MKFFDPLQNHKPFGEEYRGEHGFIRLRPAAPRRGFVRCIQFLATPALVAVMVAGGLPVRSHPLGDGTYVVPETAVNDVTLRDLVGQRDFIFLSTVIFVTSGTSQTSPADWNNSNNTIEGIGGGGSGAVAWGTGIVTGGGGGEYRKVANFSVATPGTTAFSYVIGTGGTAVSRSGSGQTAGNAGADTTFNTTTLVAKAGAAGKQTTGPNSLTAAAGGTGGTGAAANANGGSSGAMSGSNSSAATGGGGAGGPTGAGNNGGNVGSGTTNTSTAGGSADAGSGGTAGTASTGTGARTGGNGGAGAEWDATHGAGGGGGGARSTNSGNATGGTGGDYGGGGGAASSGGGTVTSGAGKQGILIFTYTPASGKHRFFMVF